MQQNRRKVLRKHLAGNALWFVGAGGPLMAAGPVRGQGLPCAYEVDVVYGPMCGNEPSLASAFGISEEGDLCGKFSCSGGQDRAFVARDAQNLMPLVFPPGTSFSRATDVEAGRVVGYFVPPGPPFTYAGLGFVLEGTTLTQIFPLPGGNNVEVERVNSSGVVVGSWGHQGTGPFPLAFRWENGVMQDLSPDLIPGVSRALDVNDNGAIAGYMGLTVLPPSNAHAFIWENGKVTDLGLMPGSVGTEAWAINNMNQVAGVAWFLDDNPAGFIRRGFFWENGVFTDLGVLPRHIEMFPKAIGEDGTIIGIGGEGPFGGQGTAFIWKAGVLRKIDDLVIRNETVGSSRDVNAFAEIGASAQIKPPGSFSFSVAARLRPIFREPGDTNCDFTVNVDDLLAVIANWQAYGVDADLDTSGLVDVSDLIIVLLNWG